MLGREPLRTRRPSHPPEPNGPAVARSSRKRVRENTRIVLIYPMILGETQYGKPKIAGPIGPQPGTAAHARRIGAATPPVGERPDRPDRDAPGPADRTAPTQRLSIPRRKTAATLGTKKPQCPGSLKSGTRKPPLPPLEVTALRPGHVVNLAAQTATAPSLPLRRTNTVSIRSNRSDTVPPFGGYSASVTNRKTHHQTTNNPTIPTSPPQGEERESRTARQPGTIAQRSARQPGTWRRCQRRRAPARRAGSGGVPPTRKLTRIPDRREGNGLAKARAASSASEQVRRRGAVRPLGYP